MSWMKRSREYLAVLRGDLIQGDVDAFGVRC
jgi:hypothetical protein